MDIQTEQDIESDINARPPTYPTIYLDDIWNVDGFNEVATRLFSQSGDPRWFDRSETSQDIAGSRNFLARASNTRQPAVLNILCAVGGLGQ